MYKDHTTKLGGKILVLQLGEKMSVVQKKKLTEAKHPNEVARLRKELTKDAPAPVVESAPAGTPAPAAKPAPAAPVAAAPAPTLVTETTLVGNLINSMSESVEVVRRMSGYKAPKTEGQAK